MHHIGRIDHDRTNNFSDRHHGGRDQALAAAQVYRDERLAQCAPMTHRALYDPPEE